jgi:ATP-binding cassette subfamily B protein
VKSFSTEIEESQAFLNSTTLAFNIGKKRAYLIGAFSGFGMLLGNIAIMCVLWYGGVLVIDGELTVGDLSSFILYTMTLASIFSH